MDFLRAVLAVVFPPRSEELLVNELTRMDMVPFIQPKEVHGIHTLADYRDERVRALVWEAKYHHNQRALELIGSALAEHVLASGSTFVVPIPLSPKRHRERGYNQVEEALLTQRALIDTHILARVRETLPQTQLPRAKRLTNVVGAFAVLPDARERVRGADIVLVDDVATTGTTLIEAQRTLLRAGAEQVSCLAFARS
jgi:ComF family protein